MNAGVKRLEHIQGYKVYALQPGASSRSSKSLGGITDVSVIIYFINKDMLNSNSTLCQVLENFSFVISLGL